MAERAPPIDKAFVRALLGDDELGAVVRAHIHIEARLNELIDVLTPDPEALPNLRYEQRAQLACALGLRDDAFPPLRVIGRIRNRFAHKLDTKLTAAMVDELYNAFCDDDRRSILQGYEKTRELLKHPIPADFSALGPRDRFVIIVMSLERLLAAAMREAASTGRSR